mmetsp:Transcript_12871/g.21770  ORF Transcript_12871/g.21770 Transcript_12871/m.21770 type:complete len:724 (-) Transcript_12871:115-2286(-)
MVDDPKEFVNLALDTCDKQKSYVVKTQASKLFEGLCDNIDGAVTLTSYFCIQAINLTLSKESGKEKVQLDNISNIINQGHDHLLEQSSFMKNSKPDAVFDASIVVLGVLSYVHSKEAYKNVFNGIDKVLSYYINEITVGGSTLAKVRYTLFLGYFSDILFVNDPEAFKMTLSFLYSNVNLQGEEKAIALQSIDTLKTIACDKDFIPRYTKTGMLPKLIEMINCSILIIEHPDYFDFVKEFIQTFYAEIGENMIPLVQTIVQRVCLELNGKSVEGNASLLVQKQINILKAITENKEVISRFSEQLESAYIPVFEFMVDPTKITFEDDVLLIIKNFIRKTQKVSPIIYKIFPTLEQVFYKNKSSFGSILLNTLNYYLIFGKELIANDPAGVQMVLKIADLAMFSKERPVNFVNSQGALLLQITLQIFQGTQCINQYFEQVMDRVLKRLSGDGCPKPRDYLKKFLNQVFLAALYYDPSATIKYMEMKQKTKDVLLHLFNNKKKFKTQFECKSFIVGMAQLMTTFDAPDNIRDPSTIAKFIRETMEMLTKIQKREQDIAQKKSKKQIHDEEESDYDSEYYSEENDDDSDDEKSNSQDEKEADAKPGKEDEDQMEDEEEKKVEAREDNTKEGLEIEKDEEADQSDNDSFECTYELKYIVELLKTPIVKVDEFSLFWKSIQLMKQNRQDIVAILQFLSIEENEKIKEFLRTSRIQQSMGEAGEPAVDDT